MIKYSLDIDGVVADYFTARAAVAEKLGIRPLSQPVGMKPEELDAFMEERQTAIKTAMRDEISVNLEEFFGGLASLATPDDYHAINRAAAQGAEVFWVSARSFFGGHSFGSAPTDELTRITLKWLLDNGFPADESHVFLTPNKASVIQEHGIRFHLDDAVAHVTNIALQTQARVSLLRQPWNQHFVIKNSGTPDADYETTAGAYGVEEVDSIAEYVTLLMGR